MKIQPLNKRILLKIKKQEQKTESGIVLPATRENDINETAKVIAVAKSVTEVKKGDEVMFKSWALDNVKIGDEVFSFIKELDVLAIK